MSTQIHGSLRHMYFEMMVEESFNCYLFKERARQRHGFSAECSSFSAECSRGELRSLKKAEETYCELGCMLERLLNPTGNYRNPVDI